MPEILSQYQRRDAMPHSTGAQEHNLKISSNFHHESKRQLTLIISRLRKLPAAQPHENVGSGTINAAHRIIAATTDTRRVLSHISRLPTDPRFGCKAPRIVLLAEEYLREASAPPSGHGFCSFVALHPHKPSLGYPEIFQLRAALRLSLLICGVAPLLHETPRQGTWESSAIVSIDQQLGQIATIDIDECITLLVSAEQLLARDPAGIYGGLAITTKMMYRNAIARLSRAWIVSESAICDAALQLSKRRLSEQSTRATYAAHIGYYLLEDEGIEELRSGVRSLSARLSPRKWLPRSRLVQALTLYLYWAALCASAFEYLCHAPGTSLFGMLLLFLLLLVLTSQCIRNSIAVIVQTTITPSELPRIDLRSGIPREYFTVVAVPYVLRSAQHAITVSRHLQELYASIEDPNVAIVLITDCPDREDNSTGDDTDVISAFANAIRALNEQGSCCGIRPYVLLHRDLTFCASEGRWIGWERKRGKIVQLVNYITKGVNPFVTVAGDAARLRSAKYVLVLDEDSRLCPGAVRTLVGTHIHPLNQAVLDEEKRHVARGYAMLAPTVIEVRVDDSSPATTLPSSSCAPRRNWLQDLLGQSVYIGKGLLQVDAYEKLLASGLPQEVILIDDIVESAFARVGAVPTAVVIGNRPSRHEVWCKRRHRWIRGDWQNARFLVRHGDVHKTPLLFGKLLILENIRDSLQPIAIAVLWIMIGVSEHTKLLWIALLPIVAPLLERMAPFLNDDSVHSARKSIKTVGSDIVRLLLWYGGELSRALHDALVASDAIVTAIVRCVTRRHLLEWETSAASEGIQHAGVCYIHQWSAAVVSSILLIFAVIARRYVLLGLCALWLTKATMGLLASVKRRASGRIPNRAM